MFRTNFRYENGKEDTFYMSTTADALLGEYAKEYYEILLKEAKTFYFRLCYPNDALPSCIMNAPRAPLKAFYDTIGLLMSGDVEKPKDWDGDYEKLPGDWKELYRMLPVDEDVKKYLLNRGFTISTGAMHTITIQAENGAMINTEIDFDGVDDYLLTDQDGRYLVYACQHEGELSIRRDIHEKLIPVIVRYLKNDPKYGEMGPRLEKMTAEERRNLYLEFRKFSGGVDHEVSGQGEIGSPRFYYRFVYEEDFDEYKDSDLTQYLTKEFRESTSLEYYKRLNLFEHDVYFLLDIFESLYYDEVYDLI